MCRKSRCEENSVAKLIRSFITSQSYRICVDHCVEESTILSPFLHHLLTCFYSKRRTMLPMGWPGVMIFRSKEIIFLCLFAPFRHIKVASHRLWESELNTSCVGRLLLLLSWLRSSLPQPGNLRSRLINSVKFKIMCSSSLPFPGRLERHIPLLTAWNEWNDCRPLQTTLKWMKPRMALSGTRRSLRKTWWWRNVIRNRTMSMSGSCHVVLADTVNRMPIRRWEESALRWPEAWHLRVRAVPATRTNVTAPTSTTKRTLAMLCVKTSRTFVIQVARITVWGWMSPSPSKRARLCIIRVVTTSHGRIVRCSVTPIIPVRTIVRILSMVWIVPAVLQHLLTVPTFRMEPRVLWGKPSPYPLWPVMQWCKVTRHVHQLHLRLRHHHRICLRSYRPINLLAFRRIYLRPSQPLHRQASILDCPDSRVISSGFFC